MFLAERYGKLQYKEFKYLHDSSLAYITDNERKLRSRTKITLTIRIRTKFKKHQTKQTTNKLKQYKTRAVQYHRYITYKYSTKVQYYTYKSVASRCVYVYVAPSISFLFHAPSVTSVYGTAPQTQNNITHARARHLPQTKENTTH